jgi:hypothetical protein
LFSNFKSNFLSGEVFSLNKIIGEISISDFMIENNQGQVFEVLNSN